MLNLFKKNKVAQNQENIQPKDWTKEIKRNQLIGNEAEQMSFKYDYYSDILDDGTKLGPSIDYFYSDILDDGTKPGLSVEHFKILKICKDESSAIELMKILKRTNKSKFKSAIIKPLIENGFFELTIPEKPKSPNQKYRLTPLFVRRRIKV